MNNAEIAYVCSYKIILFTIERDDISWTIHVGSCQNLKHTCFKSAKYYTYCHYHYDNKLPPSLAWPIRPQWQSSSNWVHSINYHQIDQTMADCILNLKTEILESQKNQKKCNVEIVHLLTYMFPSASDYLHEGFTLEIHTYSTYV